jgi:hypothetical protein
MAEVVILHVLHHDAILMNESDVAEASWVKGAEQEFLPLEGGLQVFHTIGDMGPMPQFPQPNLIGGYLGKLLGANVLKALWMAARVGYPHLTEGNPAFASVGFPCGDADVIEPPFHAQLLERPPWCRRAACTTELVFRCVNRAGGELGLGRIPECS